MLCCTESGQLVWVMMYGSRFSSSSVLYNGFGIMLPMNRMAVGGSGIGGSAWQVISNRVGSSQSSCFMIKGIGQWMPGPWLGSWIDIPFLLMGVR